MTEQPVERTVPERTAQEVLFLMAHCWLGGVMEPLVIEDFTDELLAAIRAMSPGQVADLIGGQVQWQHGNTSGGGSIHDNRAGALAAQAKWVCRVTHREPLEPLPPASTGVSVRVVGPWTVDDEETT